MKSTEDSNAFLGVFDSGIGGLSVANAIISQLPQETLIYFGDSARLPYGAQPLDIIRQYSLEIAHFLINQGCKAVVVACNTASAAALNELRQTWPNIPFIGMEPAIKPGAKTTKTGKIGVLATAGTFSSQRYEKLTHQFATHLEIFEDPCTGLVDLIETGKADLEETRVLLEQILLPWLSQNVDTFILGCTHYPFVEKTVRAIVGPDKVIINPAPAVARQTAKVLHEQQLLSSHRSNKPHHFYTSGNEKHFNKNLKQLFKEAFTLEQISIETVQNFSSNLS